MTTTGSDETKVFCQAYKPVYWSKTDTAQTVRQTKANNAVYKELCR